MRQAPQSGPKQPRQPETGASSSKPDAPVVAGEPDPAVPTAITDVGLVKAYLDGDAGAFDTLFSRYHSRVRAVAMRYVGDEHAAEDLVQETFLNVIRALPRVDASFNFGAWVHRIAVNICQDELRRRGRRATHVDSSANDPEEALLRIADSDRHNSPEDALEATYLRHLVWEVAKKLPERQRMVLTLRELQGLSYASIAHVMGISDAAVETLLHRARKRFKEEYLLLESPTEDRPVCTSLAYLLTTVGRANLSPDQRKLVIEHLEECKLCQAQFMPDGTPAAANTGELALTRNPG